MELATYQGGFDLKMKQKIAISFSPNGLISTALPLTGQDLGDFIHVKLDSLDNQPYFRDFTVSTVDTFCKAQEEREKLFPNPVPPNVVNDLSIAYRGAILGLVESLKSENGYSDMAALYSHLDCVWHFSEIMFISSHPELPILPYYMDWIRVNFDDSEPNLRHLIPELPELEPESLELLWRIIYKHVFHGRTEEAANLLEFTNQNQSPVFGEQLLLMVELMIKKPKFNPAVTAIAEFSVHWDSWKSEAETRLNSFAFSGSDHLTFIAKILCGHEDGFKEAIPHIDTWHEYLSMLINYQYTLIRPSSLKAYAMKCIDEFGEGRIVLSPLDKILLAAMDYDIVTVLKDMQIHWNHPWFPLHFSDLILAGGVHPKVADSRIDYKSVVPIRHELVREYGIQMTQHPALWEIGIKYLEAIPSDQGLPVMAELLERRKPSTEMEAQKIIRIAKKFKFIGEVKGICRQMVLQKLRRNQLQNALLWSVRANDAQLISTVVDRILEQDCIEILPAVVELVPKYSACCDRLLFLCGYSEFIKLSESHRFKDAIEYLCQMIEKKLIPKSQRAKILSRFRDIMFHNDVKLEPVEVSIIMQFLHTETYTPNNLFRELNEILLSCRATEMLYQFQLSKKGTKI